MNPTTGSSRILTATFRDTAGDLIDPVVTLMIRDPSGDVDSPTPDNPSVGIYTYDLLLEEPGIYDWQWTGTTGQGSETCEGSICVLESVFAGISA